MVYLKKPSTALLQTGVLSSQIIGEGFFLLLNSVSIEPNLNGVVLVGKFFFGVGAAKLLLLVIIRCFSGSKNIISRCFTIVY